MNLIAITSLLVSVFPDITNKRITINEFRFAKLCNAVYNTKLESGIKCIIDSIY